MTYSSWPYVGVDASDVQYGRLMREIGGAADGVVGDIGSTSLEPFGDSSGMNVKMRAGSSVQRGYMFYADAAEVITIDAASAGVRYDRLVLELNLSNAVATRIQPKIVKGTSGGSLPALTQSETGVYQFPLGYVQVDPGVTSIAPAKVFDERLWGGSKVGSWPTDARRPAAPRRYTMGFNVSRGYYEFWNGTAWAPVARLDVGSNDVTGVLDINHGGTGQSTAVNALAALGIYISATQPAYAAGRVWIKIPS